MPWKPKIRPPLVKCGTCGKTRRAGQRHTCVTRLDRKPRQPKRSTLTGPRIQLFTCPDCGKPAGPGHVCTKRSDFRKRRRDHAKAGREREKKEAAERRKTAAAKKRRQRHDPEECADEDCPAYGCVQYRKGFVRGYEEGYGAGAAAGYPVRSCGRLRRRVRGWECQRRVMRASRCGCSPGLTCCRW
ncbi:MAG TPA: hypothetical protein VMV92_20330 [Streptosporangiaceae bacterium]|nr:hypothetical protein [Streptosporangiaceae bacterium]